MGIVLPQLAPASEDRVSGALSIDGSLKFSKESQTYLYRTPGSAGNRTNYTGSVWVKRGEVAPENNSNSNTHNHIIFSAGTNTANNIDNIRFYKNAGTDDANKIEYTSYIGSFQYNVMTYAKYRDTSAWYNVVWNYDGSTAKIYVNGEKVKDFDTNTQNGGSSGHFNNTVNHVIGRTPDLSYNGEFDGYMSQFYWVDGLTLSPGFFGYTDPLTNVWRPRGKLKATVNDGTDFTADITNTGGTLNNKSRIFDGTIDSDATIASGAATITYTPSTPIAYTDSVRVMGSGSPSNPYNARWQLNGGTAVDAVNSNAFVTLDEGNGGGTITSIKLTVDSGGANWRAIEVDGIIMKASSVVPVDFGTNGFYLPFDGKTPIGEDQSGKGNNYQPVNFGGSTDITKATGAKPILNTDGGGNIARPGVFGSNAGAYYHTTSASNSGGKYVFEVQGTQPTFSFIRGATYVFDWSASSSHPIRFATAADAAGSTEYTNGTSVSGNVTTITVPHNAPDTLYYYCNVHNGMGNSISVTTDETKADPYAWKNVLAMPLVGGSGVDFSSQINATTSAKAVTVTSATSSTLSNFYTTSMNFDGSNDKLDVADSTDFDVETGDWCAECWFYTPSSDSTSQSIFRNYSADNSQFMLGINSLQLFGYLGNTQIINAEEATHISAGKWTHLALTHDDSLGANGTTTLYVDGQARATSTTAVPAANHNGFFLGHNTTHGSRWITGNYQDVRFYKGTKKYTGNFIPASTNPDILPDTPSGVATKSKLTKITEGSVAFSGTDYLTVADGSNDFSFGTGAYTVEGYLYPTTLTGNGNANPRFFCCGTPDSSSNRNQLQIVITATGQIRLDTNSTTYTSTAGDVVANKWQHIAVARDGSGNLKAFVDGRQVLSQTSVNNDITNNDGICFGIEAGQSSRFTGFMSNVRILKGTALYTSAFTPSTEPLTTTSQGATASNVKLLCFHSNSQPGAGITAPNMGGVNSGVQWSAGAGPNFEAANPARDGFNGAVDSNTRTDNADVTATINFPVPVAFSSSLKVRGARDSGNGRIILIGGNGQVDVSSQFTSSSGTLETVTITGVTSPLKGISLIGISGAAQPRFSAIYIDDVMLVDPLTPYGDVSVSSNAERINSATSFNPFTTDIDTVQGQAGSYAIMSESGKTKEEYFVKDAGLTCGNSSAPSGSSGSRGHIRSSIGMKTGKWYAEVTSFRASDGDIDFGFGLFTADNAGFWNAKGTINYKVSGKLQAPTGLNQTYGTSAADGDCIGIKVDLDSLERTVEFSKNGVPMGPVGITTTHELFFGYGADGGGGGRTYTTKWNFGQKPFKYPPRDGFQPLTSTALRPESEIARSEQYVGVATYVGNESSQLINNFNNMQPDLVWIKNRDDGVSNMIYDSVRGANNYIRSDTTNIQDAGSSNQVSFNPNGFTVSGGGGGVNDNNKNYISWTWKAGGNKNTFNVDDVGYSSASSVGMNVGGKNGEAYITGTYTSKWDAAGSTGAVDNGARAFNGDKSNYASCQNSSSKTIWRPDTPIKVNKSLRVYASGISSGNNQVFVNGTSLGSVTNSAVWYTVNVDYLIEIALADVGSTHGRLWAVEVDGRLLLDSAQTPTDNFPTIASTGCSVGTKQGFSIVQYTGNSTGGATVAHGLSQTPDFVIVKQISGTDESWRVRHAHMGNLSKTLYLNQTVGNTSNTEYISDAGAATITLSTGANGINSSSNYIVYSWHDVPGLQKFGMYEGTGDSKGPYVETGFRPALVVLKKTTEDGDPWIVYDAARNSYNLATSRLQWNNNSNQSISTDYAIDILSNGFKIRTSDVSWNDDGERFIYMAWAEAPAFSLFGAQSNAR